jgi:hypothetical protein
VYVHILEMVDEYLDRLMQARQLLLSLERQPGTVETVANSSGLRVPKGEKTQAKQRKSIKSKESSARTQRRAPEVRFVQKELFAAVPEAALLPEEQREMLKVEEEAMRVLPEVFTPSVEMEVVAEPKRETRRRRPTPMPRALGGMVSAAPVFIPAAKVREERIQKAEAGMKEERAVEEMPVTVELLTQRWVQGLVS